MTSAAHAALLNAASGHAMDYDDTQLSTTPDRTFGLLTHPTVPALAAALAVAERTRASGAAFLEAFLVGFEVECKIAEAIDPEHYNRGFHSTGTIGTFARRRRRGEADEHAAAAGPPHADHRVEHVERHPRQLRIDDQAAPLGARRPKTASSRPNWRRAGSLAATTGSTGSGDSSRSSAAASISIG